jgi:hypothetical protein|tara:strand:- start:727 stop:1005 length:279 start_codon:yes stop_codon:yes gene_type:complete
MTIKASVPPFGNDGDEIIVNEVDNVNHPPHYNKGGMEAISYIKQQLGSSYFAYLEGSVIKYIHRHKYKTSNIEDLKKASWYLDKLIEHYEEL